MKSQSVYTTPAEPESQVLWRVSRSLLGLNPESPVLEHYSIDWNLLIKRAFRHRLSSALLSLCHQHNVTIPDQALRTLQARRRDDLFRTTLYRQEFSRLIPLLGKATKDLVLFKGLAIAERFYPDSRLRPFTDMDLLVPRVAWRDAVCALQDAGYTSDPHLSRKQMSSEFQHFGAVTFRQSKGPLQVDLHTLIAPPSHVSPTFTDGLFARSVCKTILDVEVKLFSPEDTLLTLALHGEKHQWERLSWIVDIALALRSFDRTTPNQARSLAEREGILSTLEQGILLAKALEEMTDLGDQGASSAAASPHALTISVLKEITTPSTSTVLPPNLRGMLVAGNSTARRVRYFLHRLLRPNISDFRITRLPDTLFWVYYLLRPARLAARYINRSIRHLTRRVNRCQPLAWMRRKYPPGNIITRWHGRSYTRIATPRQVVALTFDDGPSPSCTEELLAILHELEVPATFFVIGNRAEKNPEIIDRILRAGHEIGNHSYSHARLYYRKPSFIRQEVEHTDTLLRQLGVRGEIMFRAPFGLSFLYLPWFLKRSGRKHILFDFLPSPPDWSPAEPDRVARDIIVRTRPGSILVLHDGDPGASARITTITRMVILELKRRGFDFLSVSQLIALDSETA